MSGAARLWRRERENGCVAPSHVARRVDHGGEELWLAGGAGQVGKLQPAVVEEK